jgi:hypothetical protein
LENIGIKEPSVLVISENLREPEDFTKEPTDLGFRVYLIQIENIAIYIRIGSSIFENDGYEF